MTDSEIIVLKSSEPFEDKLPMSLKDWLKFYSSTVGFLFLLPTLFESYSYYNDLLGLRFALVKVATVIFVVLIIISRIRKRKDVHEAIGEILSMKFKLSDSVTTDKVYDKLQSAPPKFSSSNITFKRENDKVILTNEEIDYEIILNGDGTFSVLGLKSAQSYRNFYEKIREGIPIIAFWLQQTFGVTTNEQTIQEIYERTKRSANNSNITERRQETPASTFSRNKKIIAVALIAIAGLMVLMASYSYSTPKTAEQFIERYNKEIKRTAGEVVENKYHGQSKLVENCTLNDIKIGQGCKYQTLFKESIYFSVYDESQGRNFNNQPMHISFSLYESAPVDAVFAIIEATIAAVGDDEKKVTQALGILAGNHYNIPYNYNKKINFNNKEYYIIPFDRGIVFSVTINDKKKR